MKKKTLIILVVLFILIGSFGLIYYLNHRVVSTVTIDINPSFKINLNRKNRVVSVKPLNVDAKKLIIDDFKNVSLDDTVLVLTDAAMEAGYGDEQLVVLVHATGKVKSDEIKTTITSNYNEQGIDCFVITVDNITKEDEKLAKEKNITPAKAAYINSIVQENESIKPEVLITKSIDELKETKQTGLYCDIGYELEGDFCLSEIKRTKPKNGMICPEGYNLYNDKCYESTSIIDTDEYYCGSEFILKGDECSRMVYMDATPLKYHCTSGEAKTRLELGLTNANDGDANEVVCVDLSKATHPVSPCELPASDPTERKMIGGKCYWHRAPVLPTGCPGKIKVGGECWDDASNVLICAGYRDGKRYKSRSEYCEHSIKYLKPIITEYKCEEQDYKLNGSKCEKEETYKAPHVRTCPSNYTKIEDSRCINLNKTTNKVEGLTCEDDARFKNNMCITYEIIDAKGR